MDLLESWTFNFSYHVAKDGSRQVNFDLSDRDGKVLLSPNGFSRNTQSQAWIERSAAKILRASVERMTQDP